MVRRVQQSVTGTVLQYIILEARILQDDPSTGTLRQRAMSLWPFRGCLACWCSVENKWVGCLFDSYRFETTLGYRQNNVRIVLLDWTLRRRGGTID